MFLSFANCVLGCGGNQISEAEKDFLLKQLSSRIQLLNKLLQEALDLEMQMEKQRGEIAEKQEEIKDLQRVIDTLDSKDPKHVSK